MTSLQFSLSRFTYANDEHYDTMEAALAAKALVEWITLTPHSSLFLTIDKSPSKILMKCLDGQDVRVHLSPSPIPTTSPLMLTLFARIHGIYPPLNLIPSKIRQNMSSSSNSLTSSSAGTHAKKRFRSNPKKTYECRFSVESNSS
jgi:hypothetical protein